MSKGENIYKRKDGRWEARYIKSRQTDGKIVYGYCYGKSYSEAKQKVNKCKANVLNNHHAVSRTKESETFSDCCNSWLANNKNRIKYSTYIKYDNNFKKHIFPYMGKAKPVDVTVDVIRNFSDKLLYGDCLSVKTVKGILVLLNSVLGYISEKYNVVPPKIVYPKECKNEMRVLSAREHSDFINYLTEDMDLCRFGIMLALFSGMRIGEICALRWKDISMEDKTIHIGATMQRIKNNQSDSKTKVIITSPKSSSSVRTIPVSDSIFNLCRRYHCRNGNAFVLTGSEKYMEPRALQYRLKKYTDECGLKDVHFHVLRHTFATRCVEIGFEVKSLSEILGHASTKTTLDLYVHSSMELKRENMNKLEIACF